MHHELKSQKPGRPSPGDKPAMSTGLHSPNRRQVLAVGAATIGVGGLATARQTFAQDASDTGERGRVVSYASDPNDVDAVNTHWLETEDGVVLIDAQRLLPEAQRIVDLLEARKKRIAAVFVTHAHTDHYAGLSRYRAAAPDAPIFATETTIRTIRDDTYAFNARRRARHEDRFPTQDEISENLPDRIVTHGEHMEIGGVSFQIMELTPGEADSTAMIHVPQHGLIFPGDFVQNTKIPVPFHSHETWLAQLSEIGRTLPAGTISYQGHGLPAPLHDLIVSMEDYLSTARDLVRDAVHADGSLSDAATADVARRLTERFPFHIAGGGFSRERTLNGVVGRFASQIANGDAPGPVFRSS